MTLFSRSLFSPLLIMTLSASFSFNLAAEQVTFDGEFRQGALIRAQAPAGSEVLLNGKTIKVTPEGAFAFGFDRDAKAEHSLEVRFADGSSSFYPLTVEQREYNIQRVNGIAKKIMQPDPKDVERAKLDGQQVKAARNTDSQLTDFTQDFIWPLTGRITGVYGSQRVYNGEPGRPHYGIDIAAPTGTPVLAPADGVISLAVPDMFYSGGTMIIDHGYGISSTFIHLHELVVPVGTAVKQGQVVAKVGSTGRSTGPHLDWRMNWYQMRLDPSTVVDAMPQQ